MNEHARLDEVRRWVSLWRVVFLFIGCLDVAIAIISTTGDASAQLARRLSPSLLALHALVFLALALRSPGGDA